MMMRNILDHPLPEKKKPAKSSYYPLLLRYGITVLLFPAALLRLRSESLSAWQLLTGGLWSSTQFLLAGALLLLLKWLFLKPRTTLDQPPETVLSILKNTVDLIVFVGVLQLIWQWWSK